MLLELLVVLPLLLVVLPPLLLDAFPELLLADAPPELLLLAEPLLPGAGVTGVSSSPHAMTRRIPATTERTGSARIPAA